MKQFDHKTIELKWSEYWAQKELYKTPKGVTAQNKKYILPQLPYPSGSGLHAGHAEVYTACDIYSRFQRMNDFKVLQVIGWDAFGLPAENFAIKTNVHPRINTDKAIDNFRKQITSLGVSVDWDREVGSHNADYYKWTQWFFLLMYNQGLAYRKKQPVNWCESCKTVLANEQVEDGNCERCDTEIIQRDMEQWYLKITDYADRLIADLDKVDWPAETVKRQRDWIGRSEGALIKFSIDNDQLSINTLEVFTTRPDTLFGVTFMVIAPEHELLNELLENCENKNELIEYIELAKYKTELDRQQQKDKSGVEVKGIKVINPANDNKIPLFIADYVLSGYGTGAIMGVPAHDERDFEFAKKYELTLRQVIVSGGSRSKEDLDLIDLLHNNGYEIEVNENTPGSSFADEGKMINSEFLNDLNKQAAIKKMIIWLEENSIGEKKITYKLRDWSVSRQRFWGAPIPMLVNQSGNNETFENLPKNVIQFHAWGSSPDEHFHKWLDKKLQLDGIKTKLPVMPDATYPKFEEWQTKASELVSDMSEDTVIVGRSLSAWTALKIAESKKVRKLIIAAPTLPTNEWKAKIYEVVSDKKAADSITDFVFENEIDFDKVAANCGEIVFMLSKTDPYIPFKESREYLESKLPFARFMAFRDAGHFSTDAGFDTFGKLYEEITAEVRPDLKPLYTKNLPVILPDDVDFKPTGESPLNYSPSFQNGVKEEFGSDWTREVDTLDTFMCSSWYYFRYLDPKNDEAFASPEALKNWMPVDFYLGGPEHVNGHLLYSRFFTKVLYDAGYIDFDEPFMVHRHQGMIHGEDGRKMSKRWGNVINPTDVVEEYGADTTRMYEMFMGPLEQSKSWSDAAVRGVRRFLDRINSFSLKSEYLEDENVNKVELHKLLDKVSRDTEKLKFNTAISEFMKFMNLVEDHGISRNNWRTFIVAISPYAPFLTEEIWQNIFKETGSIHLQKWPKVDTSLLEQATIKMAVQVNGKMRGTIGINKDAPQDLAEELAKKEENVSKHIMGKKIVKVIYVKGRIINLIVK